MSVQSREQLAPDRHIATHRQVAAPRLPPALRPHDLLWPSAATSLRLAPTHDDNAGHEALLARAPWADEEWLTNTPVVVRRDAGPAGWLPVGLRGRHRNERCAAWLPVGAIARCVTPEAIAHGEAWRAPPASLDVPAVAAIARIAPRLNAAGIQWGIGGSVGFALATGLPILKGDSDLDLIVRAAGAEDWAGMIDVLRQTIGDASAMPDQHAAHARIDVQIDTPAGGFALAEWLRTGGPVLLKTADGPVLVQDPWRNQ